MSEQPTVGIPQWDVADRMRKALRHSGVGVQEIAEYLDVSRNTVSTWINGRIEPSTQTLRLWALRCGVPYDWLRDGKAPGGDPDGGGHSDGLPRLDSNQQPTGYPHRRLRSVRSDLGQAA